MRILKRNKHAHMPKEAALSLPISDSDSAQLMSPTDSTATASSSPKSNQNYNPNDGDNLEKQNYDGSPGEISRKMRVGSRTDLVLSPDGKSVQLAPESPRKVSSKKMLMSDSTTTSPIFRDDVKQEWIDAMFGQDFFPNNPGSDATQYTPPKEGMGLSQIPSYLSFAANIPVPKDRDPSSTQKVGVTLSRIPIGVYVRSVDIQSESYAAGVVPGSVLIDINGMGVLGEPSHKLLERLWVHEGHFTSIYKAEEAKTSDSICESDDEEHPLTIAEGMKGPLALTFIKDGQMYSTVFFSGSPFGISWAPCSNFALVQRSYSFAKKAGLTRGCIVASVNHKSLREMDHLDTAMELKDQFTKGNDIRMVCIYTPAASRTNFHRNNGTNSSPSNKSNEFRSIEGGVKIRRVNMLKKRQGQAPEKPIEYGVGSFFTCGTGANYTPTTAGTDHDFISSLANRVAAGEIAAPAGLKRGKGSFERIILDKAKSLKRDENVDDDALRRSLAKSFKDFSDCPTIDWYEVIPRWDFFDALICCLRMHSASYDEEIFSATGGVLGGSSGKSLLLDREIPAHINVRDEQSALHSSSANVDLLRAVQDVTNSSEVYRSYLLQIVALISSEQLFDSIEGSVDTNDGDHNAKQIAKDTAKKICDDIVEIIVDAAIRDGDLCQSLHFLLRSFGSTYANEEFENGMNVLSSAHQLLRKKLLEHDGSHLMNPSLQASPSSVSNDSIFEFGDSSSASVTSAFSVIDNVPKKNKRLGKRIGKMFKSKSKRGDSIAEESEFSMSLATSEVVDSSEISPSKPRRKHGFMPTSILRKSSDQAPQHNGYAGGALPEIRSVAALYKNMGLFLSNLDELSGNIEKSLLKPFSQKITEWALQPWSASKDRALAESTADLRTGLQGLNEKENAKGGKATTPRWSPVLNPMDSSELLLSVVPEESYILPSAHFPLLLTFNSCPSIPSRSSVKMLHRTQVRAVSIKGEIEGRDNCSYVVHACIGGTVDETGHSALEPYYGSKTHRWHDNNIMEFESRLPIRPRTIEVRLSSCPLQVPGSNNNGADEIKTTSYTEIGYAFVDMSEGWNPNSPKKTTYKMDVLSFHGQQNFDQSGFLEEDPVPAKKNLQLELEVVTESIPLCHSTNHGDLNQTRVLLYKHDEDMRQEMLAIQFLEVCDHILLSSGLDLKMKKYKCIAVGENKGFIEWVPGAISLSDLCKPMGGTSSRQSEKSRNRIKSSSGHEMDSSAHGVDTSQAFVRTGAWCKHESLRSIGRDTKNSNGIGLSVNNPIQDFLRANAYDPDAPYFIRKDVMDNFVKSCAGYCVVTYLLGVGDRHTDNLLLHPEGHFLHCDYSFILGQDPKTFLPMRITEDMVNGMGGKDSDNFAKFLSFAGAAFVSLRRPSSVRILMSLVQGMLFTRIPDISTNQRPEDALKFLHDRFCLNLNDDDAVAFLEENIERSLTSKIWIAVDAIHSLGKHF